MAPTYFSNLLTAALEVPELTPARVVSWLLLQPVLCPLSSATLQVLTLPPTWTHHAAPTPPRRPHHHLGMHSPNALPKRPFSITSTRLFPPLNTLVCHHGALWLFLLFIKVIQWIFIK